MPDHGAPSSGTDSDSSIELSRKDFLKVVGAAGTFGTVGTGAASATKDQTPAGVNLYVSPDGNDDWNGRLPDHQGKGKAGPYRTLERARDEIRRLKEEDDYPDKGVTVYLRGGRYRRESTFELTGQDSGTQEAPVVYRAYDGTGPTDGPAGGGNGGKGNGVGQGNGGSDSDGDEIETPRIVGAERLDPGDFQPVSGSARNVIPSDAVDEVYELDLSTYDVDLGQLVSHGFGVNGRSRDQNPPAPELFIDGQPLDIARYPNEGYVRTGEAIKDGSERRGDGDGVHIFEYTDPRPEQWQDTDNIWVQGFFFRTWADAALPVTELDTENDTITTGEANLRGLSADQRYFYYNVLDELDSPGEYIIDRQTETLYVYPPEDVDLSSAESLLSQQSEPLVRTDETADVRFEGITFEATRGEAVRISGGSRVTVFGSVLRNTGTRAATVANPDKNASNHTFEACNVYQTGKGGLQTAGGDRQTLEPAEHLVINCDIHHYNRRRLRYAPGVRAQVVGTRIRRNEIHDAPHFGIRTDGNEHLIERNEFHDLVTDSQDAAAIYQFRGKTEQGTVVQENYFHDVTNRIEGDKPLGVHCVYPDGEASGFTIRRNVFLNINSGIFLHGGISHVARNNLILFSDQAIRASPTFSLRNRNPDACERITKNGLSEVPWDEDPYASRYPNLPKILDVEGPLCAQRWNVIEDNVAYRSKEGYNIATSLNNPEQDNTIRNNVDTAENLGFVQKPELNTTFREDSLVKREIPDWPTIDTSVIGLVGSAAVTRKSSYDLPATASLFGGIVPALDLPGDDEFLTPDTTGQLDVPAYYYDGDLVSTFEETDADYAVADTDILTVANDGSVTPQSRGQTTVEITGTVDGRTDTESVTIPVLKFANTSLENPWELSNVGRNVNGLAVQTGKDFYVASNGNQVFFREDSFSFVSQRIDSSSSIDPEAVSLEATLEPLSIADGDANVGIMLRDGTDPGAKHVELRIQRARAEDDDSDNLLLINRGETGGRSSFEPTDEESPVRVKLRRKGSIIAAYYEDDGEFEEITRLNIDMGDDLRAGIAAVGKGSYVEANVTDLVLEEDPSPLSDYVLHYPFDEPGAEDATGQGNGGTVSGPVSVADGITEGAYDFPGDGNVESPVNPLFGTETGSVSFWIKPDTLPDSFTGIVGRWRPPPRNWLIALDPNGQMIGLLRDSEGNTLRAFNKPGDGIEPGEWVHVTLTFDANDELRLYVNGQKGRRTDDGTGNKTRAVQDVTNIGTAGPPGFDGQIDDVRFFADRVTEDEVKELAESGQLAHYPMDSIDDGETVDITPMDEDASVSGPVSAVNGRNADALDFPGDGKVESPVNPLFGTESGSVSFWMKPDTLPDSFTGVVGRWRPVPRNWLVALRPDGVMPALMRDSEGNLIRAFVGGIEPGEWTHITLAFDTNDRIRLYKNGQEGFRSDAGTGNKTRAAEDVTNIGTAGPPGFDGQIDDVRLFGDQVGPDRARRLAEYRLQARYPFDSIDSGTAKDVVPVAQNASVSGPVSVVDGRLGDAYDYPGDGNVEAPYNPLYGTGRGSVSFWVNFDTLPDSFTGLVGRWRPTPRNWLVASLSDGPLVGLLRDSEGNLLRAYNGAITAGEWAQVTLTYGANDNLRLYIDGSEGFRSDAAKGNKTRAVEDVTNIGGAGAPGFDGQIDDVRLYGDTLPSSEVKDLANPDS